MTNFTPGTLLVPGTLLLGSRLVLDSEPIHAILILRVFEYRLEYRSNSDSKSLWVAALISREDDTLRLVDMYARVETLEGLIDSNHLIALYGNDID